MNPQSEQEELERIIIGFIAGKDCPRTHFRSRIVGINDLKELAAAILEKYVRMDRVKGLIACAYAKGAADGANHMLEVYRNTNPEVMAKGE